MHCFTVLLHATFAACIFTAESFATDSCFCRQLCCESIRLHTALQRFTASSLVHTFLMHACLLLNVLLLLHDCYTATLPYQCYTTARLPHNCHSTTLLPHECYTGSSVVEWHQCYYTLWLHFYSTATLHLHCELTRARNTLHYYTSATIFYKTATLLPH